MSMSAVNQAAPPRSVAAAIGRGFAVGVTATLLQLALLLAFLYLSGIIAA